VVGHGRVAIPALDGFLAGDAEDEVGIATAVEEEDGLLAFFEGRAEEVFEAVGDDMDAAAGFPGAEAGFDFEVDELDVGHGEAADAFGEGEEEIRGWRLEDGGWRGEVGGGWRSSGAFLNPEP
jgi:hypothetical protein